MCERLAFPCSWMTSFHVLGFHFERLVYNICIKVIYIMFNYDLKSTLIIFIFLMLSIFHFIIWTIQSTFHVSKSSYQYHFPLSNFTESCYMNVALYSQFKELIIFFKYRHLCIVFTPILFSEIFEGLTWVGKPIRLSPLGGIWPQFS